MIESGVLPDNESRILFSSKQIEYLRYWLKAMGLMDHLLPLPHSDCLLTTEMLRSVAPLIIKTADELKQQQKVDYVPFIQVRFGTNPASRKLTN